MKTHAPKPVRNDSDLGRLLEALEVPDCDCETRETRETHEWGPGCLADVAGPGCHHVLAAAHEMSVERWAELLRGYDPGGYADPPGPDAPAVLVDRRERIAVYAMRADAGVGLFHPADVTPLNRDRLGVLGGRRLREQSAVGIGPEPETDDAA